MYEWHNAAHIICGDASMQPVACYGGQAWHFLQPKFYFCVQFCLLFAPHSTFQFSDAPSARNWKEENLNFKIALNLVHITAESLTQRGEIVSAAINK